MPATTETRSITLSELRVLKGYAIGLIKLSGDENRLVMQLEASSGEAYSFVMSMASAVAMATDLSGAIETDSGILALVRETLADARRMKAAPRAPDADEAADDARRAAKLAAGICPICELPVSDPIHVTAEEG